MPARCGRRRTSAGCSSRRTRDARGRRRAVRRASTRPRCRTGSSRASSRIAANPNVAFISYSGFNALTPATPGHIFRVVFDPATQQATFTSLDFDLGDMPINTIAFDDVRGDLYAATDFGPLVLPRRRRPQWESRRRRVPGSADGRSGDRARSGGCSSRRRMDSGFSRSRCRPWAARRSLRIA